MPGVELINRDCPTCGCSRIPLHTEDRMQLLCLHAGCDQPQEDAFVWTPDQPRHGETT